MEFSLYRNWLLTDQNHLLRHAKTTELILYYKYISGITPLFSKRLYTGEKYFLKTFHHSSRVLKMK